MEVFSFNDWHEDIGDVIWFCHPITEAPYIGSPVCLGFSVGCKLVNQFGDTIGTTQNNVGGWPFDESDEPSLFWTPLPDAEQITAEIRKLLPTPPETTE